MSKILINTTASPVFVTDTGINILASASYTIDPSNYLLWAASSNVITYIGSGVLVVNDGSSNLSISDGTDLIKDIFPKRIGVQSGDDLTNIGHVTDRLKVIDQDSLAALNIIAASLGASTLSILKPAELAITSRNETDLTGTTYTVPTGKKFILNMFAASYDAQASLYVRLKKQTGGVGSFNTIQRLNMMSGGQGNSTLSIDLGTGLNIGAAGDVFKITIEASIIKGTIWAAFGGTEI